MTKFRGLFRINSSLAPADETHVNMNLCRFGSKTFPCAYLTRRCALQCRQYGASRFVDKYWIPWIDTIHIDQYFWSISCQVVSILVELSSFYISDCQSWNSVGCHTIRNSTIPIDWLNESLFNYQAWRYSPNISTVMRRVHSQNIIPQLPTQLTVILSELYRSCIKWYVTLSNVTDVASLLNSKSSYRSVPTKPHLLNPETHDQLLFSPTTLHSATRRTIPCQRHCCDVAFLPWGPWLVSPLITISVHTLWPHQRTPQYKNSRKPWFWLFINMWVFMH